MDDLKNSPFFDRRIIPLLDSIINPFRGKKWTPINAQEKLLLRNKELIRSVDKEITGGLLKLMNDVKYYAPVQDAVIFLLATNSRGRLSEGIEALEAVVEERRLVDARMLKKILKLGEEIPLPFAVSLVGDDGEKRYTEAVHTSASSIDLNKLRDFK